MDTNKTLTEPGSENNFLLLNIKIIPGSTLSKVRPTAKDVEAWIAQLPLMDVGRTSQQILAMMHELATADIDEANRLEIMEVMRKPLKSITGSLSKHFFISKVQLDDLGQRIFNLNIEFKSIEAQIYFHIAQRLSDKLQTQKFGLLGLNKKKAMQANVALAIHRSISQLCEILFDCQMLYRAAPTKIWARLHYLYALACKQDLQEHSIYDNHLKFHRKSSIISAYNTAILLSIINNGRVKQIELQNIKLLLEIWSEKIKIQSDFDENCFLMINQHEDSPPFYKPADPPKLNHSQYFYINLAELKVYLDSPTFLNPNSPWYPQEKAISASVVSHIKELFAKPIERINTRYQENDMRVETVFGINAIYFYLNNQTEFSNPTEVSFENNELIADIVSSKYNKSAHLTHVCDVVNTSAGGIGLKWSLVEENPLLKSGELILYRDSDQSPWLLGVIRWLKHAQSGTIDFGVQLLSHEVAACTLSVHSKNQTANHLMRGLLLSDTQHKLAPLSLITLPYGFNRNLKLAVLYANKHLNVEFASCTLDTGTFMQHTLQINNIVTVKEAFSNKTPEDSDTDTVNSNSAATAAKKSSTRFDDLWGEI